MKRNNDLNQLLDAVQAAEPSDQDSLEFTSLQSVQPQPYTMCMCAAKIQFQLHELLEGPLKKFLGGQQSHIKS